MHVFITGATGYIGGAVAARLLVDGHQVSGLARSDGKAAALEDRGVTPIRAELWDLGIVARAAREADAVVNAAHAGDSPVAGCWRVQLAGLMIATGWRAACTAIGS